MGWVGLLSLALFCVLNVSQKVLAAPPNQQTINLQPNIPTVVPVIGNTTLISNMTMPAGGWPQGAASFEWSISLPSGFMGNGNVMVYSLNGTVLYNSSLWNHQRWSWTRSGWRNNTGSVILTLSITTFSPVTLLNSFPNVAFPAKTPSAWVNVTEDTPAFFMTSPPVTNSSGPMFTYFAIPVQVTSQNWQIFIDQYATLDIYVNTIPRVNSTTYKWHFVSNHPQVFTINSTAGSNGTFYIAVVSNHTNQLAWQFFWRPVLGRGFVLVGTDTFVFNLTSSALTPLVEWHGATFESEETTINYYFYCGAMSNCPAYVTTYWASEDHCDEQPNCPSASNYQAIANTTAGGYAEIALPITCPTGQNCVSKKWLSNWQAFGVPAGDYITLGVYVSEQWPAFVSLPEGQLIEGELARAYDNTTTTARYYRLTLDQPNATLAVEFAITSANGSGLVFFTQDYTTAYTKQGPHNWGQALSLTNQSFTMNIVLNQTGALYFAVVSNAPNMTFTLQVGFANTTVTVIDIFNPQYEYRQMTNNTWRYFSWTADTQVDLAFSTSYWSRGQNSTNLKALFYLSQGSQPDTVHLLRTMIWSNDPGFDTTTKIVRKNNPKLTQACNVVCTYYFWIYVSDQIAGADQLPTPEAQGIEVRQQVQSRELDHLREMKIEQHRSAVLGAAQEKQRLQKEQEHHQLQDEAAETMTLQQEKLIGLPNKERLGAASIPTLIVDFMVSAINSTIRTITLGERATFQQQEATYNNFQLAYTAPANITNTSLFVSLSDVYGDVMLTNNAHYADGISMSDCRMLNSSGNPNSSCIYTNGQVLVWQNPPTGNYTLSVEGRWENSQESSVTIIELKNDIPQETLLPLGWNLVGRLYAPPGQVMIYELPSPIDPAESSSTGGWPNAYVSCAVTFLSGFGTFYFVRPPNNPLSSQLYNSGSPFQVTPVIFPTTSFTTIAKDEKLWVAVKPEPYGADFEVHCFQDEAMIRAEQRVQFVDMDLNLPSRDLAEDATNITTQGAVGSIVTIESRDGENEYNLQWQAGTGAGQEFFRWVGYGSTAVVVFTKDFLVSRKEYDLHLGTWGNTASSVRIVGNGPIAQSQPRQLPRQTPMLSWSSVKESFDVTLVTTLINEYLYIRVDSCDFGGSPPPAMLVNIPGTNNSATYPDDQTFDNTTKALSDNIMVQELILCPGNASAAHNGSGTGVRCPGTSAMMAGGEYKMTLRSPMGTRPPFAVEIYAESFGTPDPHNVSSWDITVIGNDVNDTAVTVMPITLNAVATQMVGDPNTVITYIGYAFNNSKGLWNNETVFPKTACAWRNYVRFADQPTTGNDIPAFVTTKAYTASMFPAGAPIRIDFSGLNFAPNSEWAINVVASVGNGRGHPYKGIFLKINDAIPPPPQAPQAPTAPLAPELAPISPQLPAPLPPVPPMPSAPSPPTGDNKGMKVAMAVLGVVVGGVLIAIIVGVVMRFREGVRGLALLAPPSFMSFGKSGHTSIETGGDLNVGRTGGASGGGAYGTL